MAETQWCGSDREARDEDSRRLWNQMRECACPEEWSRLRDELYQMYEFLGIKLGTRYFGLKRLSPEDICQCCRIGIIRAIDTWDPTRGSLTTMIAYRVSIEIRSWLRAEGLYRGNESPDPDHNSQEQCQEDRRRRRKCDLTEASISMEVWNSSSTHLGTADFTDIVREQSVPSREEETVLQVSVQNALSALDPMKREIVELYYGFHGEEGRTFRDLAPQYNVTHQTIKNRLAAAHREMAPLLDGYR